MNQSPLQAWLDTTKWETLPDWAQPSFACKIMRLINGYFKLISFEQLFVIQN